MKFSNKMIQLTFKDDSKLIIDNEKTQQVYFLDKNEDTGFFSSAKNKMKELKEKAMGKIKTGIKI